MVRYTISLLAVAACLGSACTTFNNARPLAPGEHAAMVTLGGPVADVPGVGTIPMPNATVEGRHGVVDHLDVNYGVHLLPLAFGVVGGHVGGTFQFYDEPAPWVPVTSIGQRLFFFTNLLDPRKEQKDAYALSQTDLTLSWKLWDSLVYGGVSAYVPIDVEDRTLHLAPFVGVEVHPGLDWLRVQLEGRWLSPTTDQRFAVVNWQAPGDMGAMAVNLGVAIEFSELFAVLVNDGKAPPADTAADSNADTAADTAADTNVTSTAREQP
jgi:hypothetical protein